jgi:hypothetical protein
MKVQIQRSTTGDWVRVIVDGDAFHAGHSIPDFKWAELLVKLGAAVEKTEHKPSFFTGCAEDDGE